jgi:hypothetical protein
MTQVIPVRILTVNRRRILTSYLASIRNKSIGCDADRRPNGAPVYRLAEERGKNEECATGKPIFPERLSRSWW